MRRATPLAVALLGLSALLGCGQTNKPGTQAADSASIAARTATVFAGAALPRRDRDNDDDNNDDDEKALAYGQPANGAEYRALATLVTRYYAAAAAESGAAACRLLAPFVAEAATEEGTGRHKVYPNCAAALSALFAREHAKFAAEQATMRVATVGVEGIHSLITVYFPSQQEVRELIARRIAGRWRLLSLVSGIIE